MEQDSEYLVFTDNIKIKTSLAVKVIVFGIVFWIILKILISYFGNEEIGSFFEKSTYTTQYWVYLQPENTQVKNYRVKADIYHYIESADDEYNGGGDFYLLEKVYWENGGFSIFEDCDLTEIALNRNKKTNYVGCRDNDDNNYKIRLETKVK